MRTGLIIFAIIVIAGLSSVTASAQDRHTPSARRGVIIKDGSNNVTLENYALAGPRKTSVRVATGDVNSDSSSLSNWRSVAKDESITIGGGQSEQVGAASLRSSRVAVQGMMGQQQSTFTSTSNLVQGNYIGTDANKARLLTAVNRTRPSSLRRNEVIEGTFTF